MVFIKNNFFVLIIFILLQSCSGGRIGNFLDSSFKDIEDTKLKEVLSHIYQYVSRQYNQRLNEQQEAPKRPSPNNLSTVSKFQSSVSPG